MKWREHIADFITSSRIIFAVLIAFFPAFTFGFYLFYLLGAFTDMIDGFVARTLKQSSQFGAKLDTIADIVFMLTILCKIVFSMNIPLWIWIWIALITLLKVINIISGYMRFRRLIVEHTILNKLTGFLMFLMPLTIRQLSNDALGVIAVMIGLIASVAVIQEGHYIREGKEIV